MWFLCTIHISAIKANGWRSRKMRSPHVCAAGMPGAPLGCEMSTVALYTSENGRLASGTAFLMPPCGLFCIFFSVLPKQQAEIKSRLHSTSVCKLAPLTFLGNVRGTGSCGSVHSYVLASSSSSNTFSASETALPDFRKCTELLHTSKLP